MRIPKNILGVVSTYLQPSEIHVLALLYKYDIADVLKIAILHGMYVNDIVSYPKWPPKVYFEIIHFTIIQWTVESLNVMYKLIYQRSLSIIREDLPLIQNLVTRYGIYRETVFDLLYELIIKFNCGLDLEYKMAVIKHIVAHADYYIMWVDYFYYEHKIHNIGRCVIETQNLHVFYYLYYNIDYQGCGCNNSNNNDSNNSDSNNSDSNNSDSNNSDSSNRYNTTTIRARFSNIHHYVGSAYENNNITLYNTLKIHYVGSSITNLYFALKNEYYVYAKHLVDNRSIDYDNAEIEFLLVKFMDIEHKKRYFEFIVNYLKYNKQQLLDIVINGQQRNTVYTDELYYEELQFAYDYINTELPELPV